MKELNRILCQATERVPQEYFQLPIDGREDPIYRERVYCYELYHQMRSAWPPDSQYTLSGEVDKSGHPLIRGNGLDNAKPDFLVHIPGDMGGNYAVMEVKPINVSRKGLLKDLTTLTAFLNFAGYERAIFLIYGDSSFVHIQEQILLFVNEDARKEINVLDIELWWHSKPGNPATQLGLNKV
jgi:hypothetical protein